ncbi:ROK family protein [Cohnella pontilimi]|uniref:ROK family protein n=1 Tax=Cohnella pontilimi TaxID=2564100 RepID=A0A4U0FD60_9BACL|nr:ROK family protein [Cohnella pontilimi]TJY42638.1 ROK family protein [Cohnella pontilimi]
MHITIDFGGTNIKIGLIEEGKLAAKTAIPAYSEQGLSPRLPAVEQAVKTLFEETGATLENCRGVGLALPGIVDADRRQLLSIPEKYKDAVGFDFGGWVEKVFGLPFIMENDARAALIGEVVHGAARGCRDAIMVIFGTGIGTAAMMEGKVVRGRHYQAGILGGHLTTDIHGEACTCGNTGCLEAQASHWALRARAGRYPGFADSVLAEDSLGYEDVIQAAQRLEDWAVRLVESLIEHWSAGIVNLIHAYDPETVILSGGLMKSADHILPQVTKRILASAWTPWGIPRFVVAADPETSVLLGLSHLLSCR